MLALKLNKFYSLLPAGELKAVNTMAIVKSEAQAAFYIVKDVSKTEVTKQDYLARKNQLAYQQDLARSASLGMVHFSPKNIEKRMNFILTESKEKESDEN